MDSVYSFSQNISFTKGSYANDLDGITGVVKLGVDLAESTGALFSMSGQLDCLGSDGMAYGGSLKLVILIH